MGVADWASSGRNVFVGAAPPSKPGVGGAKPVVPDPAARVSADPARVPPIPSGEAEKRGLTGRSGLALRRVGGRHLWQLRPVRNCRRRPPPVSITAAQITASGVRGIIAGCGRGESASRTSVAPSTKENPEKPRPVAAAHARKPPMEPGRDRPLGISCSLGAGYSNAASTSRLCDTRACSFMGMRTGGFRTVQKPSCRLCEISITRTE